ncbi:RNA polymerase II-associated protein 3 isoform X2 [Tripterygium wilfordii]|uniref:RNA polymerase II-associated protein 3 isoform X2 n=1 Tax=Tripterygium wilfordii TaxID=458696 RepID=UPI0018F7FEEF|nr:RNA polymerase II-associated protein 3 isoform X2 [Tripterygium wilfordii]
MARAPGKHGRDQALDWELSLKDNDKKMKSQTSAKMSGGDRKPTGRTAALDSSRSNSREHGFSKFDVIDHISSNLLAEESSPDAVSEKELGNEYFKQKKFKEAIDCYSRSIAFSPTAVAYANRAMAYLKIKRFQEAEDDCTEALNLDDRYIKAYSRRATARKELGKLKGSIEDAEFAQRLEPNNQEVKKQYAEVKSLYEKEILKKASGSLRSSVQGVQKVGKSEAKVDRVHSISSGTQRSGVSAVEEDSSKENDEQIPMEMSVPIEEIENRIMDAVSRSEGQEVNGSHDVTGQRSHSENLKRNCRNGKQELKSSVQELSCRAATRAMTEAAKSFTPPNSAFQFEVCWQGFCGDRALQARLLKVTSPKALPQIFKNALSASLLIDIIKCVATFFIEDMDLAVKYLENLTKVPRFSILIMCLSSVDKADLYKLWDQVFCNEATPMEYAEILDSLRSKYCFNQL